MLPRGQRSEGFQPNVDGKDNHIHLLLELPSEAFDKGEVLRPHG